MTLRSKVASALSFAHLAGIGQRASAEDDKSDDKDDEKAKKAKRAEGDDPEKNDQDRENGNAKGSRADGDEDDASAEDDAPEKYDAEGDEDEKKAKKASAKEDDDDEMRGNSAAAAARRRERARCASIFASKFAAKNPALAANLAFNTSMTRKEALVVLENTPVAASGYPDRQARNPALGGGGGTPPNSSQATSSSWDRAFAQANPRRGQSK